MHRNRQLDSLGDRQWEIFDLFDKEFYKEPFPDGKKSGELILSRIPEFRPDWPDELESKKKAQSVDTPNAAIALPFHSKRHWRGVGDPCRAPQHAIGTCQL